MWDGVTVLLVLADVTAGERLRADGTRTNESIPALHPSEDALGRGASFRFAASNFTRNLSTSLQPGQRQCLRQHALQIPFLLLAQQVSATSVCAEHEMQGNRYTSLRMQDLTANKQN